MFKYYISHESSRATAGIRAVRSTGKTQSKGRLGRFQVETGKKTALSNLIKFHHKILRAILKLSKYSPIVPLYFLLGEPLTQFMLDCSSLNLPGYMRVPPNYPGFTNIIKQCSITINAIHSDRKRKLKALGLVGRLNICNMTLFFFLFFFFFTVPKFLLAYYERYISQ